jgi:hypothetical protein
MGFEQDTIQAVVNHLFEARPDITSNAAVREILELLEEHKGNHGTSDSQSLQDIVRAAKSSGANPVSALSSAGLLGGS